jgi:hypothetical protein
MRQGHAVAPLLLGLVAGPLLSACMLLGGVCTTALLPGTLVANPAGELLIKEDGSGFIRPIRWPAGYAVHELGDGRLGVTDAFGGVKAVEGDRVQLPGGEISSDGPWGVCGDMNNLRR